MWLCPSMIMRALLLGARTAPAGRLELHSNFVENHRPPDRPVRAPESAYHTQTLAFRARQTGGGATGGRTPWPRLPPSQRMKLSRSSAPTRLDELRWFSSTDCGFCPTAG